MARAKRAVVLGYGGEAKGRDRASGAHARGAVKAAVAPPRPVRRPPPERPDDLDDCHGAVSFEPDNA